MAVWARAFAGAADPADDLASFNMLPWLDLYPEHMSIEGAITVAMVDDDVIAIAIACVPGYLYRAVGRGIDRGTLGSGEIESRVELTGLINRVDPIAKAGGYAAEVFIAHGLNGRCAGQQLLLILNKIVDLGIGVGLVDDTGAELVKGGSDGHI